jgi:preprotein translocase subunit SecA
MEPKVIEESEVAGKKNQEEMVVKEGSGGTKVTIERNGQVVDEKVYGDTGALQHQKPGRNDPCYCGSGKKYKKCHYPN